MLSPNILYRLKRHPFEIDAYFDYSLALSFAYPVNVLKPLLPNGLSLDTFTSTQTQNIDNTHPSTYGFLTIAMVKVRQLRPKPLAKFLGQSFFLTGYRLFVRYKDKSGKTLRGLYILRSDSNKHRMAVLGSLLSHYKYSLAKVIQFEDDTQLTLSIKTPQNIADLKVSVDLNQSPLTPPENSPFPDLQSARRFAGPMPYSFSYEAQTHSIVIVEGRRQNWQPENVAVTLNQATFLEQSPFNKAEPILANAFIVRDVPYNWQKGRVEKL